MSGGGGHNAPPPTADVSAWGPLPPAPEGPHLARASANFGSGSGGVGAGWAPLPPAPQGQQLARASARFGQSDAAAAAADDDDSFLSVRDRVHAMLLRYEPDKAGKTDALLAKNAGRDEEVLDGLIAKYGPEPAAVSPRARGLAQRLERGVQAGSDGAVYAALQSVRDTKEWRQVVRAFAVLFPDCYAGDAAAAIRERLSPSGVAECRALLVSKGVEGPADVPLANALAADLQAAVARDPADAERVKCILGTLRDEGEWREIAAVLDVTPAAVFTGMRRRLSPAAMAECEALLRERGIPTSASADIPSTVPLTPLSPRRDTRQIVGGGRSASPQHTSTTPGVIAQALHNALAARPPVDVREATSALEMVDDAAQWPRVCAAFCAVDPTFHRGDVNAAMLATLSLEEIARCRAVLRRCGIVGVAYAGAGDARPTPPGVLAGDLKHVVAHPPIAADAVRTIFEGVRDEAAWEELLTSYGTGHLGLMTALRGGLSTADVHACEQILAAKGITGEPRSTAVSPAHGTARAIHTALTSGDEAGAMRAVGDIRGYPAWADVAAAFRTSYPHYHAGDLRTALEKELRAAKATACFSILRANGVDLDVVPVVSDALYKAMKGLGTDEDAIYRALSSVRHPYVWDAVLRHFRRAHPKFHKGDVVAAMRDELTSKELGKCEAILQKAGVQLGGGGGLADASKATLPAGRTISTTSFATNVDVLDVSYRGRVDALLQAYEPQQAHKAGVLLARNKGTEDDLIAGLVRRYGPEPHINENHGGVDHIVTGMHAALIAVPVDTAAVVELASHVRGAHEWGTVVAEFRARHAGCDEGNLLFAMEKRLPGAALRRCRRVLAGKGIAGSALPGSRVEDLHGALAGVKTDTDAVFTVLKSVTGVHDWAGLQAEFKATYPAFHQGDVIAALKHELATQDISQCNAILAARGIPGVTMCISEGLYKALSGAAPDGRAVNVLLSSVDDEQEWLTVEAKFKRDYPRFYDGSVTRAMEACLTPQQQLRCRGLLVGKGVAASPKAMAADLNSCLRAVDVDGDTVCGILRGVAGPAVWHALQQTFRREYPSLHRGDLVAALHNTLSGEDLVKCADVLAERNVHALRPPPADQTAKELYKAMKGFGTDEDAVYTALARVTSRQHWDTVAAAFARGYPKFHSGRVDAALKDELTAKELAHCHDLLRKRHVELGLVACGLHKAMDRMGTDEDAIYRLLSLVETQREWRGVESDFLLAHDTFHKGQLIAAMKSELSAKELARCEAVLEGNGVDMYGTWDRTMATLHESAATRTTTDAMETSMSPSEPVVVIAAPPSRVSRNGSVPPPPTQPNLGLSHTHLTVSDFGGGAVRDATARRGSAASRSRSHSMSRVKPSKSFTFSQLTRTSSVGASSIATPRQPADTTEDNGGGGGGGGGGGPLPTRTPRASLTSALLLPPGEPSVSSRPRGRSMSRTSSHAGAGLGRRASSQLRGRVLDRSTSHSPARSTGTQEPPTPLRARGAPYHQPPRENGGTPTSEVWAEAGSPEVRAGGRGREHEHERNSPAPPTQGAPASPAPSSPPQLGAAWLPAHSKRQSPVRSPKAPHFAYLDSDFPAPPTPESAKKGGAAGRAPPPPPPAPPAFEQRQQHHDAAMNPPALTVSGPGRRRDSLPPTSRDATVSPAYAVPVNTPSQTRRTESLSPEGPLRRMSWKFPAGGEGREDSATAGSNNNNSNSNSNKRMTHTPSLPPDMEVLFTPMTSSVDLRGAAGAGGRRSSTTQVIDLRGHSAASPPGEVVSGATFCATPPPMRRGGSSMSRKPSRRGSLARSMSPRPPSPGHAQQQQQQHPPAADAADAADTVHRQQQQIDDLRRANDTLRETARNLTSGADTTAAALREKEREAKLLQRRLDTATAERGEFEAMAREAQGRADAAMQRISSLRRSLQALEETNKGLREEVRAKDDAIGELQDAVAAAGDTARERDALHNRVKDLTDPDRRPRVLAGELYAALQGPVDAAAARRTLTAIHDKDEWRSVCDHFRTGHPAFYNGAPAEALRSELPADQLRPCVAALRQKGVDLYPRAHRARVVAMLERYQPEKAHTADALLAKHAGNEERLIAGLVRKFGPEPKEGGASASPHDPFDSTLGDISLMSLQNTNEKEAARLREAVAALEADAANAPPTAVAARVYDALKGNAADRRGLERVLGSVRDIYHWHRVAHVFKCSYPQYHGGNLTAALRGGLTSGEHAACKAVLAGKGVDIDVDGLAGNSIADGLRRALCVPEGGNPDGDAAHRLISYIGDVGEWRDVVVNFSGLHADVNRGDVVAAMKARLPPSAFARCEETLRDKGVDIHAPVAADDSAVHLMKRVASLESERVRLNDELERTGKSLAILGDAVAASDAGVEGEEAEPAARAPAPASASAASSFRGGDTVAAEVAALREELRSLEATQRRERDAVEEQHAHQITAVESMLGKLVTERDQHIDRKAAEQAPTPRSAMSGRFTPDMDPPCAPCPPLDSHCTHDTPEPAVFTDAPARHHQHYHHHHHHHACAPSPLAPLGAHDGSIMNSDPPCAPCPPASVYTHATPEPAAVVDLYFSAPPPSDVACGGRWWGAGIGTHNADTSAFVAPAPSGTPCWVGAWTAPAAGGDADAGAGDVAIAYPAPKPADPTAAPTPAPRAAAPPAPGRADEVTGIARELMAALKSGDKPGVVDALTHVRSSRQWQEVCEVYGELDPGFHDGEAVAALRAVLGEGSDEIARARAIQMGIDTPPTVKAGHLHDALTSDTPDEDDFWNTFLSIRDEDEWAAVTEAFLHAYPEEHGGELVALMRDIIDGDDLDRCRTMLASLRPMAGYDDSTNPAPPQAQAETEGAAPTTSQRGGGPSSTSAARGQVDPVYRERVVRFFEKYAPDKVGTVDDLLANRAGREETVIALLVRRYGPEPTGVDDTPATAPAPAMDANASSREVGGSRRGGGGGHRARLIALFEAHDPAKIDSVDAILAKNAGKEERVIAELARRYEEQRPPTPQAAADASMAKLSASRSGASGGPPAFSFSGGAAAAAETPPSESGGGDDGGAFSFGGGGGAPDASAHGGASMRVLDESDAASASAYSRGDASHASLPRAPGGDGRAASHHARLRALFACYDPRKLDSVDAILAKNPGKEERVIAQFVKIYGPEPAAGPRGDYPSAVTYTSTSRPADAAAPLGSHGSAGGEHVTAPPSATSSRRSNLSNRKPHPSSVGSPNSSVRNTSSPRLPSVPAAAAATPAAGAASTLYKAMKGFGTDEDAIYATLSRVSSPMDWADIRAAFRTRYPDLHDGDVVAALKDELNRQELMKCDGILRARAGVPLVEAETRTPAAIATSLHKSMKGFGTDEDAIYKNLGCMSSAADWAEVRVAFRTQHADFHNGDVVAALRDELTAKELAKCNDILRERTGVPLYEAAAAAPTDTDSGRSPTKSTRPPAAAAQDPSTIAASLYKAMNGLGTDEDGIYKNLRQLASTREWAAVRATFRMEYPDFHDGDVVAALKDELTAKELAKCNDILRERTGVPLYEAAAAATPQGPAAISESLYKAMKGLGTDEDGIYKSLGRVSSVSEWAEVRAEFRAAHADFHNGDLVAALKDELTAKELAKCNDILRERTGVPLYTTDPPATTTPTSAAAKRRRPSVIATSLHKSMNGLGTDEDGIYKNLGHLSSAGEWAEVKAAFRIAHGDFHDGDVVAALKDELTAKELTKCNNILRERTGVPLYESRTRTPVVIANSLHKSMKGLGTDEDGIYKNLGHLSSAGEWAEVKAAFRAAYPKFHNGDVVGALKDELTAKELAKCNDILRERTGVPLDEASAPQRRLPTAIATSLHKSMKGFGTDEDGIYKNLGHVSSAQEWNAVKAAFRRAFADFHDGDVVAALKDELTAKELAKCNNILRERTGVPLDEVPPLTRSPTAIANSLYKAMKGFGTDEDGIYKNLGCLSSAAEWGQVKAAFRRAHADFHNGDVVAALRDELTMKELTKSHAILLDRTGVPLYASAGPPASSASTRSPAAIATSLHKSMKGFGTDEDGIYKNLGCVNGREGWREVQAAFRERHAGFHNGDVVAALRDELTAKELAKCEGILRGRGAGPLAAQGGGREEIEKESADSVDHYVVASPTPVGGGGAASQAASSSYNPEDDPVVKDYNTRITTLQDTLRTLRTHRREEMNDLEDRHAKRVHTTRKKVDALGSGCSAPAAVGSSTLAPVSATASQSMWGKTTVHAEFLRRLDGLEQERREEADAIRTGYAQRLAEHHARMSEEDYRDYRDAAGGVRMLEENRDAELHRVHLEYTDKAARICDEIARRHGQEPAGIREMLRICVEKDADLTARIRAIELEKAAELAEVRKLCLARRVELKSVQRERDVLANVTVFPSGFVGPGGVDGLTQRIQQANHEQIAQLSERNAEQKEVIQKQHLAVAKAEAECEALRARCRELEAGRRGDAERAAGLKARLREQDDELTRLQIAAGEHDAAAAVLQRRVDAAEKRLSETQATLHERDLELLDLRNDRDADTVTALQGDKEDLRRRIESLDADVAQLTGKADAMKEQERAYAAKITDLEGEIDLKEETIVKMRRSVDSLATQHDTLQNAVKLQGKREGRYNEQVLALDAEKVQLESQVRAREVEVMTLKLDLKTTMEDLRVAREALETQTKLNAELSGRLSDAGLENLRLACEGRSAEGVREQLEMAEVKRREFEAMSNTLVAQLDDKQRELDAANTEIHSMQTKHDALEQTITKLRVVERQNRSLREQVDAVHAENARLQESTKEIPQLHERIAGLTEERAGLQGVVKARDASIEILKEKASGAEQRYTDMTVLVDGRQLDEVLEEMRAEYEARLRHESELLRAGIHPDTNPALPHPHSFTAGILAGAGGESGRVANADAAAAAAAAADDAEDWDGLDDWSDIDSPIGSMAARAMLRGVGDASSPKVGSAAGGFGQPRRARGGEDDGPGDKGGDGRRLLLRDKLAASQQAEKTLRSETDKLREENKALRASQHRATAQLEDKVTNQMLQWMKHDGPKPYSGRKYVSPQRAFVGSPGAVEQRARVLGGTADVGKTVPEPAATPNPYR